eukprot:9392486-Pyramimonas_sp.AAC.1
MRTASRAAASTKQAWEVKGARRRRQTGEDGVHERRIIRRYGGEDDEGRVIGRRGAAWRGKGKG